MAVSSQHIDIPWQETPTAVLLVSPIKATQVCIRTVNGVLFIGGADVSRHNGLLVPADGPLHLDLGHNDDLYGVAACGQGARVEILLVS